ncbi:MAG: hypothetical protein NTW49_03400 [Bacteroidia bacterium]|nr:hypothetical protein [Bacteroidia bacterium]
MKKSIFIFALFTISIIVKANIAPPKSFISEFKIDSTGIWQLEIGFYSSEISGIDSIKLESSTAGSVIVSFILIPGTGYPGFDTLSVISVSNLKNPVTFNPEGDYVKLISYSWGNETYDYFAFGNYPGAELSCINIGESAAFVYYIQSEGYTGGFCIDSSPTINSGNDTTGCLASLSGHVFDSTGNFLTQGCFYLPALMNTRFTIHSDGSFSERILSRRYIADKIDYYYVYNESICYLVQPFDICIRPDSSAIQDIHFTGIYTNVDNIPVFEKVTTSPNPFTGKLSFYINLKSIKPNDNLSIEIFDQDGKILSQLKVDQNQTRIDWFPGSDVKPGILTYSLVLNELMISSGKIVKL